MKQLEPLDDQMRDEIEEIVEKLNNGEDVEFDKNIEQPRTFVRYILDSDFNIFLYFCDVHSQMHAKSYAFIHQIYSIECYHNLLFNV